MVSAMTRLSKHERLQVTYAIEDTLENYCRACPYFNLNTPSKICVTCPVSVQLKEYGVKLGFERKLPIERNEQQKDWTDADEKYLIEAYKNRYSYSRMAADLDRTVPSINMRLRKLRDAGKIVVRSNRK